MTRGNEVKCLSQKSESACNICRYPREAKTGSDVGKGEVYNLIWKADAPVIDVGEQLPFRCPKVNGCLLIRRSHMI